MITFGTKLQLLSFQNHDEKRSKRVAAVGHSINKQALKLLIKCKKKKRKQISAKVRTTSTHYRVFQKQYFISNLKFHAIFVLTKGTELSLQEKNQMHKSKTHDFLSMDHKCSRTLLKPPEG